MLLTQTLRKQIKQLVYNQRVILIPFQFDYADDKGLARLSYDGTQFQWQEDRNFVASEPVAFATDQALWDHMDRYLDPFDNVEAGMKLFAEQHVDVEPLAKLTGTDAMAWYRQEIRKVLEKDH